MFLFFIKGGKMKETVLNIFEGLLFTCGLLLLTADSVKPVIAGILCFIVLVFLALAEEKNSIPYLIVRDIKANYKEFLEWRVKRINKKLVKMKGQKNNEKF